MCSQIVALLLKKSKLFKNFFRDGIKRVVLFSQYPQYCCSTSGSSFNAIYSYFKNNSKNANEIEWSVIDRWFSNPLLIKTFASNIQEELKHFPSEVRDSVIILFTAHSLPMRVSKFYLTVLD